MNIFHKIKFFRANLLFKKLIAEHSLDIYYPYLKTECSLFEIQDHQLGCTEFASDGTVVSVVLNPNTLNYKFCVIEETIRHEAAHALAAKLDPKSTLEENHHGLIWQACAIRLGALPVEFAEDDQLVTTWYSKYI